MGYSICSCKEISREIKTERVVDILIPSERLDVSQSNAEISFNDFANHNRQQYFILNQKAYQWKLTPYKVSQQTNTTQNKRLQEL